MIKYSEAKEKGLCNYCYTRPKLPNNGRCQWCYDKLRTRYAERIAAGLCPKCASPLGRGISMCEKCHQAKLKGNRKRQKTPHGREIANKASEAYKLRVKMEVLSHYSPSLTCQKCGFPHLKALTIDHINGGGNEHRRKIGVRNSHEFYKWIVANNYPVDLQVLCMNCQFLKR